MLIRIGLLLGLISIMPLHRCPAQTETAETAPATDEWTPSRLWEAARSENVEHVQAAIAAGVDVNSKTDYGATALLFACDRGNEPIVKLLLEAGADPNIKDSFYNATPLTWAIQNGHQEIAVLLFNQGGEGADQFLLSAIEGGDAKFAEMIIKSGTPTAAGLTKARDAAQRKSQGEKYKDLPKLFDDLKLPDFVPIVKTSPELLQRYVGKYLGSNFNAEVEVDGETLKLGFTPESKTELEETGLHEFTMGSSVVKFEMDGKKVKELVISFGANQVALKPAAPEEKMDTPADPSATAEPKEAETPEAPQFLPSSPESLAADLAISSANWSSFRGTGARGVAEGQHPPLHWTVATDAAENVNLKWKTAIPGLGLSCPSIWGDKIYVTSAVSENADGNLKIGQYGNVDSVQEDSEFDFNVYCLNKNSGELLWERTATSGKPAVKRHAKSSHANSTVATNGEKVIAFFGSEGLYCYSSDGELVWKKDLGFLDSGWFYDAGYQWGFGSSPIIFNDQVIVQCDIQGDSFIAAFALASGEEVWRTERDEIPSWSTPVIHQFGDMPMLLTHATKAARGYDARNGELLWTLSKHSEIVVPTPFVAHDLIFVASGYAPVQPIYAIRPTARGDISVSKEAETNEFIAWSMQRGGPYMPTPIVYGDYLYCCANSGVLTCYQATTGQEVYKKRMSASGGGLSFTASPLAADGHLYFTAEDGRVLVVKAGPEFELVATNTCGESVLATPAISNGVMYLRTQNSLIAVGE